MRLLRKPDRSKSKKRKPKEQLLRLLRKPNRRESKQRRLKLEKLKDSEERPKN